MTVYEVRVTLLGTEPPVWRRVRVPADAPLALVHSILQIVMGWEDDHLHAFVGADRKRYGVAEADAFDEEELDEHEYPLSALFSRPGERGAYLYDFGDDWLHGLELEAVTELGPDEEPICCLEGAGACPPEDCGGAPGYAALLERFRDRADEGHEEAVEWLGEEFDPEDFDGDLVNDWLRGMLSGDGELHVPDTVTGGLNLVLDLRDFLDSEGMPEGVMSVMALHGFFSALAIHPVTIMLGTWLPWVWDISGNGREPEFASQQEIEKGMGLLFTYFNSVTGQLNNDPEGYAPLFEEVRIDSDEEYGLAAADWAVGFTAGVMLDEEVWMRTFKDRKGNLLLAPFAMLSGMFDDVKGLEAEQLSEMKAEVLDKLGFFVLDLQAFWLPWRQEYLARQGGGLRTVTTEARVGRNDPCPCGSGKKYKQCCGR